MEKKPSEKIPKKVEGNQSVSGLKKFRNPNKNKGNRIGYPFGSFSPLVTSGSRKKISLKFKKCGVSNKSIQNGRPGRYRKTKQKQKKAHRTPPPDPNVQTTSRKEPQKKEKADNSSVVPSQLKKCLGRLEKDVQPINGLYRELQNPHERPRKTLAD